MSRVRIFDSLAAACRAVPAGSMKRLLIGERRLTLAHTSKGWFAFDNLCPHQHEPLHKGRITPYFEVVCPLHHYRFDLVTGRESSQRCGDLQVYRVIAVEEGLFVEL